MTSEAIGEGIASGPAALVVKENVAGDAEHPRPDLVVPVGERVRSLPQGEQGFGEKIGCVLGRIDAACEVGEECGRVRRHRALDTSPLVIGTCGHGLSGRQVMPRASIPTPSPASASTTTPGIAAFVKSMSAGEASSHTRPSPSGSGSTVVPLS